ncbi:hypothetical protein HAX54_050790, partial [Datura stramonium]|nr:hypothetical protein [Datura stramonium]
MEGGAILYINRTTFHPLQIKGLFGGLMNEDAHQHIKKFLDVGQSLTMGNISKEAIWLRKERVDEENMEHGCSLIPFEELLEAVLLNRDIEEIEEFEE